MATLWYQSPSAEPVELLLKPGVNLVGRRDDCDIPIPDPSVSSHHCELTLENQHIRVRELGSTNGTFINDASISEALLEMGNILRVGNVVLTFQHDVEPIHQLSEIPDIPIPTTRLRTAGHAPATPRVIVGGGNSTVCANHPGAPAQWSCPKCSTQYCSSCIMDGHKLGAPNFKFCPVCSSPAVNLDKLESERKRAEVTFGQEMVHAWRYPFVGDGLPILIGGAVFLVLAALGQMFLFIVGILVSVFTTGYLIAYTQKVVAASAQGDDQPPTWPDFSDFIQDIIVPFFQAVALFALYLMPFYLSQIFLPKGELTTLLASGASLLLALFLMPMAWLAVSVHESIAGLSPHFVIRSILRIPGQYFLVVIQLILVVAFNLGLEWFSNLFRIPVLSSLISSFLSLYFMMVTCRMLGVLYHRNRDTLAWF